MYWIQEYGGKGQNRSDWKMFHCDYRSDITNLPLNNRKGVQQENDIESCKPAHYGDQCLCLEDSSVWELGWATNNWSQL